MAFGAFSGLQLTADETPNENPAPRRRMGGVPRAAWRREHTEVFFYER